MRLGLRAIPARIQPALCGALLWACQPSPGPRDDTDAPDTDPGSDTDRDTDDAPDTDLPSAPRCGDGLRDDGELCDDGNLDDADDCTRACVPTPPPGADALVDVAGSVACESPTSPPVTDPAWLALSAHVSGVALLESGESDAPLTQAELTWTAPGQASISSTTDATTGAFAVDLTACTPWTATLRRADVWPSVRHFLSFVDDADTLRLRAPGPTELDAIAELAGGALLDSHGVVAGHATDCTGAGLGDAMVVLRAEDGRTPLDLAVVYLDSDSGGRTTTPADGAYVIPNVPPGVVWVETWARRDGQIALRARAKLTVLAGQIDWADLPWGRLDGTRLDARCAAPPSLRVF